MKKVLTSFSNAVSSIKAAEKLGLKYSLEKVVVLKTYKNLFNQEFLSEETEYHLTLDTGDSNES